MIAIIEGPDGTGKTTLAKKLAERGMVYHYRQRHNNYATDEMTQMLYDDKIHVLDRSFLTTWVYRLVQNEPLDKCDFSFEYMYAYMTSRRLKIVYCNYPFGFRRAIERGEDNITSEKTWNKLKETYEYIVRTILLFNICPLISYDFATTDVDMIEEFLKEV